MARNNRTSQPPEIQDYRHDSATRRNNPPAGIASHGGLREKPKQEYAYNPHLPPVLRFDDTGDADQIPELLQIAQQRPLTDDEARILADALKDRAPWLEWAGKQETKSFAVDPVALHIHERLSAKAILSVAARQDVQRDMFADPQQEYHEAVQFYRHDVDWSNRLILGDSLTVMSSLAHREDLAGKVQMIYIDPPYGIKFSSNFQPTVFQRDVKDKASDLTREREQIQAYRDTWTLGVHTYLAYLRDRLIVAKDLLTESGSIFVQIGDENVHRVRSVMDEVFRSENFVSQIVFKKTAGKGSGTLDSIYDTLLWYSKDVQRVRYRQIFVPRQIEGLADRYNLLEKESGDVIRLNTSQLAGEEAVPKGKRFRITALNSQGETTGETSEPFMWRGHEYNPPRRRHWSVTQEGLERLAQNDRLILEGKNLCHKRYLGDYPVANVKNVWIDTGGGALVHEKLYVVQTATKIIERCLLMTTDPGDLVLDPTCGSGTTAYVAEGWGRRWIAIDTSRVAVALARQRLLTGSFDYYELKDKSKGVAAGFANKTVPHITLKSIAQNTALDPIFAEHEPILKDKLWTLNHALGAATPEIRTALRAKLAEKQRREGKRAITDADRRRWELPTIEWKAWEVPFDSDPDWPHELSEALTDYRAAWRAKMDEVNECIAAASDSEELVDQPEVDGKTLRVSGPFTVEAVQPAEESLHDESPIGGEPEEMSVTFDSEGNGSESTNAEAYLDGMIRLLRGLQFADNQTLKFATLEPLTGTVLHAEGGWEDDTSERRVAVAFGPQHGPVTAIQVEECLRIAFQRGYDELVFAGFNFQGEAQAVIQADPNPKVRIHMAHIPSDATMGDLLKVTPSTQLFSVCGLPRTEVKMTEEDEYVVVMAGVDVYNPVDNMVTSEKTGDKVAAWFIDSDYDGRTFCITQAFFPDKAAWSKIVRALKGVIDEERFENFSGTTSLPFPAGEHQRVAVKVIDPRGNEVMRVHNLGEHGY